MPIPETSIGGSYTQPQPPPLPPRSQVTAEQLARMAPEERSRFQRIARMDPPLQVRLSRLSPNGSHIRRSLCVARS